MAEPESIEGTLSRIGQTLGRLEQSLEDCWGRHSENKAKLQEQFFGLELNLDEALESLRQEVDRILSQLTHLS